MSKPVIIKLHHLDKSAFYLNADIIDTMRSVDTSNGTDKIDVQTAISSYCGDIIAIETPEQIIQLIKEY
jgi:uncharacterized protein YlzI (FlbEa/FlbD family)